MKLIILSITLFSISLHAKATYQLFCQGNRGKAAILFEQIENKMRFTYTNVDGKEEFPFYEGVVTNSGMPYIKMAQKDLSMIDRKLVFEWNIEQCKTPTDDPMIIACDGEAALLYPKNAKIKSYDISTSKLFEKSPTFTYEMFRVKIGLDTSDMHYLSTMPFDPKQCVVKTTEIKTK